MKSASPDALAARLAGGIADAEVIDWWRRGWTAYLNAQGELPLERCLQMAGTTATRMRLLARNNWLAIAAAQLAPTTPWFTAVELAEELDKFVERGPWAAWRELSSPPTDASQLRTALFHVARALNGRSMSARQIHRILCSDAFSPVNVTDSEAP